MAKKIMGFKTKGMNRDLSVSAFSPEFAFENKNLRLGTNEANTMMSWVNEKGTASIGLRNAEYWSKSGQTSIVYENPNDSSWTHHAANTENASITGTPIGTAVINHQLVIFTTDTSNTRDYIYVLKYADSARTAMLCKMLFGTSNQSDATKSLSFSIEHPLETLVSYESEKIQKVYWTDGINQPRVVNIEGKIKENNNTQFDFVPTLKLEEEVTVKKMLGASGTFAPGVIQYALTYYNKYGQESNIFYTSPLNYISYRDRGASPEDKVENAFQITVDKIDTNFDYLRIYSIQRTSIDATPICKRIQDIEITGDVKTNRKASYIDVGTSGDAVDPTELLYKGGEFISAYTMEQKDNTLFLGNINITRQQIDKERRDHITNNTSVSVDTRKIEATKVSTGSYLYSNQLTAYAVEESTVTNRSVPCAGFKRGDTYRLGVQFQYKSGKWSDPVWVGDKPMSNKPDISSNGTTITLPIFTGTITAEDSSDLISKDYIKARGVVVFPSIQDRTVLCQGVVNPTLWTTEHHTNGDLWAQASWFFRASHGRRVGSKYTCSPASEQAALPYTHRGIGATEPKYSYLNQKYDPQDSTNNIRLVEVQGDYEDKNKFRIDRNTVTFHSPDLEFDTQMSLTDFSGSQFRQVGYSKFTGTLSDIDIQTETATISNMGAGFVHKSFSDDSTLGIISGLFYDDYVVDDSDNDLMKYRHEYSSCKWMVYLWNKSGSLNNDINRPANQGTASATLKKKIISNLRVANTNYDSTSDSRSYKYYPRIFNSDQVSIVKLDSNIYMGNIDTAILPDNPDGNYFAFGVPGDNVRGSENVTTSFGNDICWKTFSKDPEKAEDSGLYRIGDTEWKEKADHDVGNSYLDLLLKKEAVRMKYKSTAHLVFTTQQGYIDWYENSSTKEDSLPVIEILKPWNSESEKTRFGGTSTDAFRENIWLPCGEPVALKAAGTSVSWEYGDTYFQRWDCLKTYAFTHEDINQVVEIGSFMLETHINIDGRYDRNRGQMNNLYMSPVNFNLINPIYSQRDNFFQYRIQDDSFYEDNIYPNQITWAKTKSSGADTDAWTNVTLASTLELDGDKGEITSLQKYNNQLLCFQDSSFCRISYNETYQITTTEGVPVEVANSGKVQGKNYISDTVGCSNKWSIVNGTMGLYFMDSAGKGIYLFNGQLASLADRAGFNAWCKLNIPSNTISWNPSFPSSNDKSAFVSYYDRINQDVLFINRDTCLAFSEKFGMFTSFYDYNNVPFYNNLDDTGIWLKGTSLWKHQAGDYCSFFGTQQPYWMTLIGNPEPQVDKIFTNLEFRACVDGEGLNEDDFTPFLPFNSLETWNEYQHGITTLSNLNGHSAFVHHSGSDSSLKRKFRIWRCDIPRDNAALALDADKNITRFKVRPMDRMRNPWLYLKLMKNANSSNRRTEIHDVVMTYFS